MTCVKIDITDKKMLSQWRCLVHSSPMSSWFQTVEAYEFFLSIPNILKPFGFALYDATKKLKGVLIGFIIIDNNRIRQFFTRRAIINGGPLLSDDITSEALSKLLQTTISHLKKSVIYVEIRNFSNYNKWTSVFESTAFCYKHHYDIHIDCYSDFKISDSKLRQIKKSLHNGVEIATATSLAEIDDFYQILNHLYRTKIHTPLFPLKFFHEFFLQEKGVFLLVKYNSKIIGGAMCPILTDKVIYEWFIAGNDKEYKTLYPSVIATWAIMDYANKNHIQLLDLMGAGVPDKPYGVRNFKLDFGGKLKEYGRFLHINNKCLFLFGKFAVKCLKREF